NARTLEEERRLRRAFESFVPSEVMNALMGTERAKWEEGVSQEVTVLFSDIRNFTSRSCKTDPRILVRGLHQYFKSMTDIVYQHGGIVDKFLGDGLFAVFNAFGDSADHTFRAVRAAYDMARALPDLNAAIQATCSENEEWEPFQIGIGIHTGTAVLG